MEIAVNVYTAMTEATLFHFAHSLANSVKARPDMLNLDAGAPPRKKDCVSKTAQLSYIGGERIQKAAIKRDHRALNPTARRDPDPTR
jgi:hypothetical protein